MRDIEPVKISPAVFENPGAVELIDPPCHAVAIATLRKPPRQQRTTVKRLALIEPWQTAEPLKPTKTSPIRSAPRSQGIQANAQSIGNAKRLRQSGHRSPRFPALPLTDRPATRSPCRFPLG